MSSLASNGSCLPLLVVYWHGAGRRSWPAVLKGFGKRRLTDVHVNTSPADQASMEEATFTDIPPTCFFFPKSLIMNDYKGWLFVLSSFWWDYWIACTSQLKKYIIIWVSMHNCTIALVRFAELINAEINSKAPLWWQLLFSSPNTMVIKLNKPIRL